MKTKLISLLFLSVLLVGCNSAKKNTPEDFDYGRVEKNRYINSYFNFEMNLPAGWNIQTKGQMESLQKRGNDLVAGDNSTMKAVIKASEINTANLLMVFQYKTGAAVDYNPGIMLIAENVKNFPGIETGNEYLFQARKLILQSQIKYDTIDSLFTKETIGGVDFYKMNTGIKYNAKDIKQTYYSTVTKGFSFNIIISYVTDKQKADLLKSVNSMKFGKQ
jgi:hypothetical protein